jgi:hypothetical protein
MRDEKVKIKKGKPIVLTVLIGAMTKYDCHFLTAESCKTLPGISNEENNRKEK